MWLIAGDSLEVRRPVAVLHSFGGANYLNVAILDVADETLVQV